ncbi:MAG: hypothetical protein V2A79_04765 [Planctomycetota bacterium]
MAKATQFCVGLDNQPGTLAKLCAALARAKVNIGAISVADNAECCWVRLVATPTAAAKAALKKGRFNFCTQRVLTVKLANRPGELQGIAAQLARAGVNMNYVYGSNAEGASSMLVLSVCDLDRAAKALGA